MEVLQKFKLFLAFLINYVGCILHVQLTKLLKNCFPQNFSFGTYSLIYRLRNFLQNKIFVTDQCKKFRINKYKRYDYIEPYMLFTDFLYVPEDLFYIFVIFA